MKPTGPASHRVDRLVYLPVAAALLAIWVTVSSFTFIERGVVLERLRSQLGATVATLADFNELAMNSTGDVARRSGESRTAAIWRALLQYPTARIWVETSGAISAGEPPPGDLASFIVVRDQRSDFTVHAALPQSDALAEWHQSVWQRTALLVAVSFGFVLLARVLARASRQRAIAEQALQHHDALLNVVTQSAAILLGTQPDDAVAQVIDMIGVTVDASRVQLCRIVVTEQGHMHSTVEQEWCAPEIRPTCGDPPLRTIDLNVSAPPTVAPALAAGNVAFFAGNTSSDLAGLFEAASMRSFLLIPVTVEGAFWGSLNFIDSATIPRQWNWAESDALKTLAGLVGVALTRAKYVQELADANMIVQNSPTILYRLSGEPPFPLIYVSHNITKFGHDADALIRSADWMNVLIDPADKVRLMEAMGRVLDKTAEAASIEFRLRTGDGGNRWVENRYTAVRDVKDGRLMEIEGIIIDITERKAAEEKIALMARTDSLTGLANRATFVERLRHAFAASRRGASPFAIHSIDLDHFKNVNDTLGHPVGDLLLCEVASRLQACTRETDLVARFGGDEFALLQMDAVDAARAGALALKLQEALAKRYLLEGHDINFISASIGICPYTPASADPDTMLAQVDLALYRSKDEGRNQFRFHSDELDAQVRERVTVMEDLKDALDRDELELYYQPQVEIVSGAIVGMEALLRWRHPRRGLLQDGDFILIAERAGMMPALGQWVMNQACRQLSAWRDEGIGPPHVAINLSLSQVKGSGELLRLVAETTTRWGITPADLEFEVTEATLAQATLQQNDVLLQLRALGAQIGIDEFGAEYSSFEYLRAYRVSHLKIARSVVGDATVSPGSAATIRAIMGTARQLGINVIAPGVETPAQLALLAATGAPSAAQGYVYSAPVDAERAGQLLRQGRLKPSNNAGSDAENQQPRPVGSGRVA